MPVAVPPIRATRTNAGRRRAQSARETRSCNDLLRKHEDEDDDDDDEDDDFELQDWSEALDKAKSVADGMRILYESDKETFYLYGADVKKNLELRFEMNIGLPTAE